MLSDSEREAFVALSRLARNSRSEYWKTIIRYGWTARKAPSKSQIEADYERASRSARYWQTIIANSRVYGTVRKYTLRCNNHARMYAQYANILRKLLERLDNGS